MAGGNRPRRCHACPPCDHLLGHPDPAEAAGHRGSGYIQGAHLPHQPLGLCLYRRIRRWRTGEAGRQARGRDRHRCYRAAGHSPCGSQRQADLRLPAHPIQRGRARQPRYRPAVGRQPPAGLAEGAPGQLPAHRLRRGIRRRPDPGWLDHRAAAAACHDHREDR
ncbi:hypothetical protein D3C74_357040 [compost metagenome]